MKSNDFSVPRWRLLWSCCWSNCLGQVWQRMFHVMNSPVGDDAISLMNTCHLQHCTLKRHPEDKNCRISMSLFQCRYVPWRYCWELAKVGHDDKHTTNDCHKEPCLPLPYPLVEDDFTHIERFLRAWLNRMTHYIVAISNNWMLVWQQRILQQSFQ